MSSIVPKATIAKVVIFLKFFKKNLVECLCVKDTHIFVLTFPV